MVKRSSTYTKDISTLSKDEEKENVHKPAKTARKVSNVGVNQNDRKSIHKPSFGKHDRPVEGTSLRKRRAGANYVRRERKDRSDRFARHAYTFLDRVSCFG